MEILIQGQQSTQEATDNIRSILRMFRERYGVVNFRKMRLEMILMDKEGDDVELVDAATSEVYQVFEVTRTDTKSAPSVRLATPLRLVVDNTRKPEKKSS